MSGSQYTLLSGISGDGSELYLSDHINFSPKPGGLGSADIWTVPILPVVDLNGDTIVNFKDACHLFQCWGQNESSVDIGPPLFGDHKIDSHDMAVLSKHWLATSNMLPGEPRTPTPNDGETQVTTDTTLQWTPGAGTQSQEVYFGTSIVPELQATQFESTFDPGPLAQNTTYFWRVDQINPSGMTTGPLWTFTTKGAPR